MVEIKYFIDNSKNKFLDIFKEFAKDANEIDIAVAYLRKKGFELIKDEIQGKKIRILFSLGFFITEPECIRKFIRIGAICKEYRTSGKEEIEFHPKLYIFKGDKIKIIIGSSNLTEGGFLNNVESCIAIEGHEDESLIKEIMDHFKEKWNSSKSRGVTLQEIEDYESRRREFEEKNREARKIIEKYNREKGHANSVIVCMTLEHDKNDIYNRLIGVPDGPGNATRRRFFTWIKKGTRIFIYYKSIGIKKIVEAVNEPYRDISIIKEWRDGYLSKGELYPNRIRTKLVKEFLQPLSLKELRDLNIKRMETDNTISPRHLQQTVVPITNGDGDLIERKLEEKNAEYGI